MGPEFSYYTTGLGNIFLLSLNLGILQLPHCAVPKNIHTQPMDGRWKFRRGW